MAIEIIATGRSVPARRVSNSDLADRLDTNDEWIRSHTGIGSRHLAAPGQASSDLALEAARNALAMAASDLGAQADLASRLDFIVLCSATPDYNSSPSTACIVQDKLGAENAAAMDVNAGCSGFVYGLETAAGLLLAGKTRKYALVIGAEVLSVQINWEDRSTAILFGDGAGAVLLEKTGNPSEGQDGRGLLLSYLRSDGSGAENLIWRKGGSRNPYKTGDIIGADSFFSMNGRAVYNFAVKAFTDVYERLIINAGITKDDIDLIVPHQANARILQAGCKRLGISEELVYCNVEEYANTSAASIPLALDELNRQGRLKRGDLVMTIAFGAGLTYGGNLILW